MANSTITLGTVVSYVKSFPDIASVVQQGIGGQALQPALTIGNMVMTEMIKQIFNWKWNRFVFSGPMSPIACNIYLNGFQQDYATNNVSLGWLEHGFLVDINNTALPKPIWPLEVVRDLEMTSMQYGMPGQVSWLPNDQLYYGTWGATNTGNSTLGLNPGPNMTIGTLLGVYAAPINPVLQVRDSFGNLWMVTTFGTTGASNPFASNLNPVFPTPANPTQAATTVTDGTVTWTAINPKGFGVRVNPIPPQTGVVYQVNLIGQYRAFAFTNGPFQNFDQTIEPIPDDFSKYFLDGFVAMSYAHSSDKAIRAKYADMVANWQKSLMDAKQQGLRERENAGFAPSGSILQQPFTIYPGPAYPFPLPWG